MRFSFLFSVCVCQIVASAFNLTFFLFAPLRFIVFEAKVLKENVADATKLLGELCAPAKDVSAGKASMLATLDSAAASPDEVMHTID
jgi:hypothetical protein